LFKKVNRVSTGRRKIGIDGIKLAIVMVGLMVVIAVFLMVVGNLDLSHIGARTEEGDYNADTTPTNNNEVEDNFVAGEPLMVRMRAEGVRFYHEEGGLFELPLIGATGWVAADSILRAAASGSSDEIADLQPGTGFTILNDNGDWWQVRLSDDTTGWVDWRRCFINLPDVVPSMVFNITNASASLLRSNGYALAGITGQSMYAARAFNHRLGRYEYIVPAMYPLARALHNAQQSALEIGHTLVIYETFRPQSAQTAVANAMNALLRGNTAAARAFDDSAWPLVWFIPTGVSNHQRGGSVNATLARVNTTSVLQTGGYSFLHITNHTEITTGSPMHEISAQSAITETPRGITTVQINNETANMTGPAMTNGIAQMQLLFAASGLSPLASMWWHFDHQASINMATASGIIGDFTIETVYSIAPVR